MTIMDNKLYILGGINKSGYLNFIFFYGELERLKAEKLKLDEEKYYKKNNKKEEDMPIELI